MIAETIEQQLSRHEDSIAAIIGFLTKYQSAFVYPSELPERNEVVTARYSAEELEANIRRLEDCLQAVLDA
jgi:hypothetical protein